MQNSELKMRASLGLISIVLICAGCAQPAGQAQNAQPQLAEMRTIESVDPRPQVIDPPPMLTDEAPPPKPKLQPWETPKPIILSPEDEKLRASLPFVPAIAMDPIDGSKISLRALTPMFEYKGRIYYFQNEANKRMFASNPDSYLTGRFTRL